MASDSRSQQSSSIWPGYVDVLSSLLMVVIFVLLIFTFSQFILSRILTSQSSELESLHQRIAEISELLGLERETTAAMTEKVATLSAQVETLTIERTDLQDEVEELGRKNLADRETIEVHLRTIASLQQDIQALQTLRRELENRIGETATALATERDRSKVLEAQLAEEGEKTLLAQKDIEQRDIRLQALSALIGEQQEALDNQRNLTADARAEVALLNQKINELQRQLAEIGQALGVSEREREEQHVQIEDLGKRLNIELARKVGELEQYKSEFFGRLRAIVADNPLIRIEGDRFLLQAELLFPSGTAELSEPGKQELEEFAKVLGGLIPAIPQDLNWILQVDGHTDRIPINTAAFASNWDLSTARAVSVVRFLAGQGLPEKRLAAAGFGEFHPIDPAGNAEAYRKNRRIEMKLTSR